MAMSTEDRVAARKLEAEYAAALEANGGVDPALTRQFGITDPDLAKYLQMSSLPGTIAWGDPSRGGSRSQEQAAARASAKFASMGGQEELDRIQAKIAANPALQAQLSAAFTAGNKGDVFSRLGDAFVSAVPAGLMALGGAGIADIAMGGTLFGGGFAGAGGGASVPSTVAADPIAAMTGTGAGVSDAAALQAAMAAPGATTGALSNLSMAGLGYGDVAGITGMEASGGGLLNQAVQSAGSQVVQQAGGGTAPPTNNPTESGGGGLLSGIGGNKNALGLAATLGAAALGGKGGNGNMATTTTQEIPNQYVQQYLPEYLSRASTLSNKPYESYTGKQVADFTPYQTQALDLIANRAASNPLYDTGYQTLQDTASGKYLDPNTNPYLQGTINKSLGDVRSMMGNTFGANNFGSSAHEELMQRRGIEAISPILMQNYQQERGNQLNAASQAPQYAAAGYNDANQLLQAGNMQQGQQQNVLTSNYNDWLRQQEYPYQSLGVLGGAVNVAGKGGNSATTNAPNPYAKNSLASGLGMAATTAGLANQMGLLGTPATANNPAKEASPWAWPMVIGGGLLGSMG